MRTVSASDSKKRLGELLEAAQHQPITVTRNRRPSVVVISTESFERQRRIAEIAELLATALKKRETLSLVDFTEYEGSVRLVSVMAAASETIEDPTDAADWLVTPNALTLDKALFELLRLEDGEKLVLNELGRIDQGIAA